MAKYTVTRACGHVETVNLIGKMLMREWRLEHVEPYKLCSECYQAELAKRREEADREAAEAAKEMNLPELLGSEKQVAWAEAIRQNLLAVLEEFMFRRLRAEQRGELLEALDYVRAKQEARWWIDHRFMGYDPEALLEEARKELRAALASQKAKPLADEAKAEATVRPENPKTETVAEIRALASSIEITFPERRDDFYEIVKHQLRMEWENGRWRRELCAKNGLAADRAAEAGHRLLAAGFIIRIYDPELRCRAVAGEYEPECTRWVQVRKGGQYDGWFAITWSRDEDFYSAARRIAGSRWSSPSVVVPPEQYEQVLDFAQRYGFRLSERAQELVEVARQAKEAALVARVEPSAKKAQVVAGTVPPKLEVPQEVGVDETLRDKD